MSVEEQREPSIRIEEQPSYREPSIRTEEQPSYRAPATHNDELVANRDPSNHNANESDKPARKPERMKYKSLIMIVLASIVHIISFYVLITTLKNLDGSREAICEQHSRGLQGFCQDELDKSNVKLEDRLVVLKEKLSKVKSLIVKSEQDVTFQISDVQNTNQKIAFKQEETVSLLIKASLAIGQSCQQLLLYGRILNGVYTLTGDGLPFWNAYCNQDLGGYTVFQRRFDGSTSFNQSYQTYVDGFGIVTGEYWLGLERLHQLTKTGSHKLRVDLVAYDGTKASAIYDDFSIGAAPGYQLNIGNYHADSTAGDSLTWHKNMEFSTVDHDADTSSDNCANDLQGAFWYISCSNVNLNAFEYTDVPHSGNVGMNWKDFKGGVPLKESTMMVL